MLQPEGLKSEVRFTEVAVLYRNGLLAVNREHQDREAFAD
jgi:hypothetical protein